MPGYWVSDIRDGRAPLADRFCPAALCGAHLGRIATNGNGYPCTAGLQTCADCRRPYLIFLSSFSTHWPRIDRDGTDRRSIYQVTMQVPCQALTINGLAWCTDLNVNFADRSGASMGWIGDLAPGAADDVASGQASCPGYRVNGADAVPRRSASRDASRQFDRKTRST